MKILLFDMMNTLVEEPYPSSFLWLLEKRGLDFAQFQKARNRQTYLDFESGRIGEYEFYRNYYRDDLSEDLKNRLPRPQKIKKAMFRKVAFLPGIEDFLFELQKEKERRADFQTGIASNYSAWYWEFLRGLSFLEESMDYLFFSCELSARKPGKEFYTKIQEALLQKFSEELSKELSSKEVSMAKRAPGSTKENKKKVQIFFTDDRLENLCRAQELSWTTHLMEGVEGLKKAVRAFLEE